MGERRTVVLRKIDPSGRIVIPYTMRKTQNISIGDTVEITSVEDGIVIRRYGQCCVICGKKNGLVKISEKPICVECVEKIKNNAQ